jgi:putative ABC transport system permease protein
MGLVSLARAILNTLGGSRLDRDARAELAFHIESRVADLERRGMPRQEAQRRARIEFGSVAGYAERAHDVRHARVLEDLARDLLHACRALRRTPGLVVTCVLSLGLGIGVNVALLSTIRSIFFATPTVARLDRLVVVEPGNSNQLSYPNLRDLQESGIFAAVVGSRRVGLNLRSGEQAERVFGLAVTPGFFEGLGIQARWGRVFTASESVPEREPRLAVLDHTFWLRRFAGDPAIVGQWLTLNGEPYLVLGILADSHRPLTHPAPELYLPISAHVVPGMHARLNANALTIVGRLHDGATGEQAQAAVTVLGAALERTHPRDNAGFGRPAQVFPLAESQWRGAPQGFFALPVLLLILFGLLLLIACANVAGLLLARAAGRRREIAIRIALGARRGRLLQWLLAESLVLAALGAAAGLVLARMGLGALGAVVIDGRPLSIIVEPDFMLYSYGLGLALVTGLACGIVPALRATRTSVVDEIQQGGGHGATGRLRLRHALVIGQVAASMLLLLVSSLMLHSMRHVAALDPGFDVDRGLVATIDRDTTGEIGQTDLILGQSLVERLEAVPGVDSAALLNVVPLGDDIIRWSFTVIGGEAETVRAPAYVNSVGPRYFETLGIRLLRGRDFSAADQAGTPAVAIVSEAFARAYFPGEDPIGRRVTNGRDPEVEIVGIVADSKVARVSEPVAPLLYFAYAQRPARLRVIMRIATSPAAAIPSVRRAILDADGRALAGVETLRDATSFELNLRRVASVLFGSLGSLGLLLAVVGLYGIVAFLVTSRTREIGIRVALGASARRVLWGVLARGLTLVGVGVVIGGSVGLLATRPVAWLFAGVHPADPVAWVWPVLVLMLTGLAASYVPARRATRVDPTVALRDQ